MKYIHRIVIDGELKWYHFNFVVVGLSKDKKNAQLLFLISWGFFQNVAVFDYLWTFVFRFNFYPLTKKTDHLGVQPGFSINIPPILYKDKRSQFLNRYRFHS